MSSGSHRLRRWQIPEGPADTALPAHPPTSRIKGFATGGLSNMIKDFVSCPQCNARVGIYQNPIPTVDIIIEMESEGIILIKRKNPPHGWAIPGGFVDYGESLEEAAIREAKEETNLEVELIRQFHTYSDPEQGSKTPYDFDGLYRKR